MKITYPTKLSEIPLLNYQKWMQTAQNSNDEELMAHKFVEIFLGVKLTDVRSMAVKDVNFFIEQVVNVLNTKPKFKKRWKYGKHEFGLITDFENMSWGEYIDIESNLTDVKNWHKAIAVLYRPIVETYKDTYKIMEYKGDDTFHEAMKYAPLDIVLGIQVFFLEYRKRIIKSYPIIFKERDEEDERESDYSEGKQFSKQYGWYHSIYRISKGDVTKFTEVTTLPIHKAFTFLSYEVQKDRIEYNHQKRQLNRSR